MKQLPYFGVTGFMTANEIDAVRCIANDFRSLTHDWYAKRRIMIGVLASSKTLAGIPNKWPNRYPDPKKISGIFSPHYAALNLIHYASDDKDSLHDQLQQLIHLGGSLLDGFQLNMRWPHPAKLVALKGMRVVLQIGAGAMGAIGDDPAFCAKCLDEYIGTVTDVLIDASGGKGIPMQTEAALRYVRAIRERHPNLGIGVAGGLSSETLSLLDPIKAFAPDISIDAEGALRNSEDHLDIAKMDSYLYAAKRYFLP